MTKREQRRRVSLARWTPSKPRQCRERINPAIQDYIQHDSGDKFAAVASVGGSIGGKNEPATCPKKASLPVKGGRLADSMSGTYPKPLIETNLPVCR